MRIIHVEDYFDPKSGYQINELVRAWSFREDEIIILTSADTTPFQVKITKEEDEEFEKLTGAKVIRLKPKLKISTRLLLDSLWETIESLEPDVLFLHGIGDFKDLILFSRKRKYPVFRDCHMTWTASINRFRHIYYVSYRSIFSPIINRTDKYYKVFAVSHESKDYLIHLGVSENKIDLLPLGYNSKIMYFDELGRNDVRNTYGFDDEDIVISYIGKFDEFKKPDLIFDILRFVDRDILIKSNIGLLFIGYKNQSYMEKTFNPKLEEYKKMFPSIKIVQDDGKAFDVLRNYFSASDIVIYPKGTTLSSIHAQICGCAVIMESHLANVERIVDKDTLYEIGNLKDAALKLEKVLKDERFRRKKENVHKSILYLKDFDYNAQVLKLRTLFEKASQHG